MPSKTRSTIPAPTTLEPQLSIHTRSLSLYPRSAPMTRGTRVQMGLARGVDQSRIGGMDEMALRHLGVRWVEDPLLKVLSFGVTRLPREPVSSSAASL